MHKMREFLLWRNCTNQCDFCWQCKMGDMETLLSHEEMLTCINETIDKIKNINKGDDVLLVGGEILASYNDEVNKYMHRLIDLCIELVKTGYIRFLYINTNLMYEDRVNLVYLLDKVKGIEDRLKFTTSYDIRGRFRSEKSRATFLDNLKYIRDNYPKVNVVVNTIITKQMTNSCFNFNRFKKEYGIKYINFIPYIPVKDNRSMDVDFKSIVKVLLQNEKKYPGYIKFYIRDLDMNQDKILYEYHKNKGYIECTSEYGECGHNVNFRKVTGDGCYICKLKDLFGY